MSVKMIRGFKLRCIGIPGDGCGGGREFFIENETLYVYDPFTRETTILLENIQSAKKLSKNGCKLTIETTQGKIVFDLSTFTTL